MRDERPSLKFDGARSEARDWISSVERAYLSEAHIHMHYRRAAR